jgi:hypothetical protein
VARLSCSAFDEPGAGFGNGIVTAKVIIRAWDTLSTRGLVAVTWRLSWLWGFRHFLATIQGQKVPTNDFSTLRIQITGSVGDEH